MITLGNKITNTTTNPLLPGYTLLFPVPVTPGKESSLNAQFSENEWIASPNEKYILILRLDGNLPDLYVYEITDDIIPQSGISIEVEAMWNSTNNIPITGSGSGVCAYQSDNNLVLYPNQEDYRTTKDPLWSTSTQGKTGLYLGLNDSGELTIFNMNKSKIFED